MATRGRSAQTNFWGVTSPLDPIIFITVRNEVAKLMFLHVSVIQFTGGPGGMPGSGRDAWFQGGAWSWGGTWSRGGLLPGGGVWYPTCTEPDSPRDRWLLLRTGCILLECILVLMQFLWNDHEVSLRSGTLNSNTVNSKFHLIRSFFEIFARLLSFHV